MIDFDDLDELEERAARDRGRPAATAGRRWCVVGGAERGGIPAREGRDASGPPAARLLSRWALLREEERSGDSIRFALLAGDGPEAGWADLCSEEGAVLLEPAPLLEPRGAAEGRRAGAYAPRPRGAPAARKVRVLCLHGAAGSKRIMSSQLAVLMHKAKQDVEFLFAEGSLVCDEADPIVGKQVALMKKYFEGETFRQWAQPRGEGWRRYDGLERAALEVQEALEAHAPVDALLGFSQGANIAHVAAAAAALGRGRPLRCVVHMCPSKPGWVEQMPDLFEWQIALPAMVIAADQDTVAAGAREVAGTYEEAVAERHSGVHRPLPAERAEAAELSGRIQDFLLRHCRD